MKNEKPTALRLDQEIINRLNAVVSKTGVGNRSSVIKLCVQAFLDDFEARGTAALPLDWKDILRQRDGRVTRFMVAETNGHGNTVIINNHSKAAHYTKAAPKKRKGGT